MIDKFKAPHIRVKAKKFSKIKLKTEKLYKLKNIENLSHITANFEGDLFVNKGPSKLPTACCPPLSEKTNLTVSLLLDVSAGFHSDVIKLIKS